MLVHDAVDAEPVTNRSIHEAENCPGISTWDNPLVKEIGRAEAAELLRRRSPRLKQPLFRLCKRCRGMK